MNLFCIRRGKSGRQNSGLQLKLEIFGTQSRVLRNSGQHLRPDFYSIVKCPNVIAPLRVRQDYVRASL
jgi:hypothetical protein